MGQPKKDLYTQNVNNKKSNSKVHGNIYNDEYRSHKQCETDLAFIKVIALQKCPSSKNSSYNTSSEQFLPMNCPCHKYRIKYKVCTYCNHKVMVHSDSNSSDENSGANKFISTVNNIENRYMKKKTKSSKEKNKSLKEKTKSSKEKTKSSKEKTKSSKKKTKETNINNKDHDLIEFPSDLPLSEVIKMFKKDKEDIKAEALRNGKTLKVSLERIVLYDKNSNVINVSNKTSELHEEKLNRDIQQECDMDINLGDLELHINNAFVKCKNSIIQTNNDLKEQQQNNDIMYKQGNMQRTDVNSTFENTLFSKYNKSMIDQAKNSLVSLVTYSHKNVKETPIVTEISVSPTNELQMVNDKECNKTVEFCNDKLTSFELSNNYSSKHIEKDTLVDIQQSTKTGKELEKKSTETRNISHDLNGSTNLQKQKRLNNDESNTIKNVKKIKLVTTNWCEFSRVESETNNMKNNPNTTINVVASNTTINVPEIIQSTDTLNIPNAGKDNEVRTSDVLVTEGNLNITQGSLSTSTQISVGTFEYSNILESNTQNDTKNLQDLVIETSESSSKNEFLALSQINSNDDSFTTDEDDCISLFADSELLEEFDISGTPVQEKINNYFLYKTYQGNDINHNNISQKQKQLMCPMVKGKSGVLCSQNPQTHNSTEGVVNNKKPVHFLNIFGGYCYSIIRKGNCPKSSTCRFSHQFLSYMTKLYTEDEQNFFDVIDQMISHKCDAFLKKFYNECLFGRVNITFKLKMLKKLHSTKIITNQTASDTIARLKTSGTTMNVIINCLAAIVDNKDVKFVMDILIIVLNYVPLREYWSTTKPLLMKVKQLELKVIHILLCQCLVDKTYVQEIYDIVICKLSDETRKRVDGRLLSLVNNILEEIKGNKVIKKTEAVRPIKITLSNPTNVTNEPESALYTTNKDVNTTIPNARGNGVLSNKDSVQNKTPPVRLRRIVNLPNTYSVDDRKMFGKFYAKVHSLQKGLNQNDYEYIKNILDAAQPNEVCLFIRAFYNILRNEVERSEYHLSMLSLVAAQTGASSTFYKIFNDVTIHILVTLAERELWVLAFKLLKNIEILLHEESSLCKFDAGVLMLFAEIYLANHKPLKAYNLLKQSNIIYTYRGKWKVRNNVRDDDIRAQIVPVLLNMLCETSSKHAYYLFEFLIMNQSNNFYPIDLSNCANKVISTVLSNNDHDLTVSIGKLIDIYDCTPKTITYRALISSLVRIDLTLAKELYESAVLLGVYPKVQFDPVVHIIVKSDWTIEEMYLTILMLTQQIIVNAGHALDGIGPKQCSVYLLFENTPSEQQLVHDEGINILYEHKIEQSKMLMKRVLEERFDPPLSLVSRKKGKLQKLNSVNLYRYLQHNQNFIQSH
ncbi:uncharacterized protein LOC116433724 isoform X2 [Nomia melanderi]|uniref:uncharacterized protein LOC116433724 isoform X2 n=1 Tax=Nomia melanderi TaxID=2448451 RepID=UPI003FCE567C